jgi:heavy metal translocating P-type ATPase
MPKRKLQMRFRIEHELKGRMRLHVCTKKMSYEEADTLQYYLGSFPFVTKVKVHENIGNVTVNYVGSRKQLCEVLAAYRPEKVDVPDEFLHNSGRKLNEEYKEKLINKVLFMAGTKLFLPAPVRTVITVIKAGKYWKEGIKTLAHRKIEVPVLDATAIGVSVLRGDMNSANSIMFLLGIGEILEEWTHKKSVEDLARSMSLNITKVWQLVNGKEVLVPSNAIVPGDEVVVHMGNVIPFDGVLTSGDAMVNQASLTGEPLPVHKTTGGYVYAGTVVEDGDLTLKVEKSAGGTRFEKVVAMIEDSEKLKSSLEGKAEHLADRLVPYTLAGTGLVYLLTRNVTKTLAVLMVDFSCALKLAMPISVLSAIREASHYQVTVKGGKYLEAMSEADTIVFDKTGTLTKAQPTVVDVIPFCEAKPDELLRIAACLEEHFPHSMAKAVVDAAAQKGLVHEEIHSKVEYIVAHGISSFVEGKKVVIGSAHFIFEDEKCVVPEGYQSRFDSLPEEYSHLYLAVDGKLCAVICIEDPLREEAAEVIQELKKVGIKNVVMMTGDSDRTARAIAARVGVDRYFAEVLPEDKAHFVEKAKANGSKVIMIGDGINDSPALSAADVGIAISDGAEIAREIADVTVGADNLYQIVTLKQISNALMKRIHTNYRRIVAINAGLIVLGVAGVIQPTTSALLHNSSTLVISLESMKNLLEG